MRFQYSPPTHEADFEELCLKLLRLHWNCSTLDLYGHRGEAQYGVDIVDLSGDPKIRAAQCKCHGIAKTIASSEIVAEVNNAKTFRPHLAMYWLMTTAKRSRQAQDTVLSLNKVQRKSGLFAIELMTWDKIEVLLDQHSDLRGEFYTSNPNQTLARLERKISAILRVINAAKLPSNLPASIQKLNLSEKIKNTSREGATAFNARRHVLRFKSASTLLREIEAFILELGCGFTFVARQKRMQIGGKESYLDLLFYHRKLKCMVAIELKLGKFKPEFKDQMNLYLRWLEKHEQGPDEAKPIGLILCAEESSGNI